MITDREKVLAIVDNDCLTPSDAAILLEGDGFFRFKKAVCLYKEGLVKKIVFSGNIIDRNYGSFPYEEVKPYILKEGVPEGDIIHEDISRNTRQQAIEIIRMSKERGWGKIILVASPEHQYRAYLTFLREVLDSDNKLILYNAPARNLKWFVDSGWGNRYDRLSAEFERIERYSAIGHLANAKEAIEYQEWKESLIH